MAKHPGGRPTKYKPEYCDILINEMEQGADMEEVAGLLRVTRSTIYEWLSKFPEFSDAKKIGDMLSYRFWAKAGRDGMYNETIKSDDGNVVIRSLNPTLWIFNMKNRFKWGDRHEVEVKEVSEDQSKVEEFVKTYIKMNGVPK